MKILNTQQIRETDQYTIENEPIDSIDLMERASKAFFDAIKRKLKKHNRIKVFCGMGNNGGDGLAVARMLLVSGYDVTVFKLIHTQKASDDFSINEERLNKLRKAKLIHIGNKTEFPEIKAEDIVIDALFGSGLNRPLEGLPAEIVIHINRSGARVIAIDIPSGLFGEENSENIPENIVKADYTFTFQFPKLSFMFPENEIYLGHWQVLDIGLDKSFIEAQDTPYFFLLKEDLRSSYRYRKKFDHKGKYGHALLISGSEGKAGAAVLAAQAALKMGIGLLTVHIPRINYVIQHSAVPEAMVSVDEDEKVFTGIRDISPYSTIAAGPGLGKEAQTANALKLLIQNSTRPLVLDADALNILAENPTWLSFLPAGSILTPHVGEFERLAGKCISGWERLEKARDFAFRFNCYLVLKGAHTAIISPDKKVIFNSTGNPGMATGGTGDVLTGMILGLLTQGYSPQYSAMAGVFLHGLAADIAARKKPLECILAGDLVYLIDKSIKMTFY
ncbi:MAG: NAD(P)H-hydrate dehydratase [Bacteroidetes bacterium]|nr:MAG: NAD(P)H-hydrate dehydratase [Bacteroidota bacterium]